MTKSVTDETSVQMKKENWAEALESSPAYTSPRRGEVLRADILAVEEDHVLVHLPRTKRDGIVPSQDLDLLDESIRSDLHLAGQVPVCIMRGSDRDGFVVVSINQGLKHQGWLRAEELLESGEPIDADITESNKGGMIVSFAGLRGFVPNSHLGLPRRPTQEAKEAMIGQKLHLSVIEVDQRRRRLILSARKANRARREQLLAEIEEGDLRTGTVRSLVDFGAFVDLGGVDGLIHVSELDWQFVEHPGQLLSVGDEVKVLVLDVDRRRERISLSRKRLLATPSDRVVSELEGDVIEGAVTQVKRFGTLVDIGEGVEGLVRATGRPDDLAVAELESGVPVAVRVLDIEAEQEQVALEIRDPMPG